MTDDDGLAREYGVFIYRDEICWQLAEHELVPTGEFSRREALYDDSALVRIRVDEHGRGRIVSTAHPGSTAG